MSATEFLTVFRGGGRLYEKMLAQVRAQFGMTQAEVDVLGFLHNNPQMDTASDIVEYRMMPKANVSQAVELLTKRGYLSSQRDENDRRRVHLKIMPQADEAVEAVTAAQKEFGALLFSGFSEEEMELYYSMGMRISDNITNSLRKKQ